jgi:predicted dehydrogenase
MAQDPKKKKVRPPYRVAVIGSTGRGNYGHGLDSAFQDVQRAEIVAVADPHESGRQKVASRLKVPRAYADYRKMLNVEKPDIVCVCPGWVNERVEMVTAVAEAGAHIYCEKPFTSTLEAAHEMYRVCRKAGIKLAMAHQWAAMAPVRKIIHEIREGKYGKLLRVYIRPKDDSRGGGHELILHGTHHFDLLFAMAGQPRWVFGHLQVDGRDVTKADRNENIKFLGPIAGDSVSAMIGFEHGTRAFFDSTAGLADKAERGFDNLFGVTIECAKRRIQLRAPGDAYLYGAPTVLADIDKLKWEKVWIDGWHFSPDRSPRSIRPKWLHIGNKILANDLIDAIQQDREPISGIERAMLITEVVQGVYASHLAGRRVNIPLKKRIHPLEDKESI